MAITEDIVALTLQTTFDVVNREPDWLEEALRGMPRRTIDQQKQWMSQTPSPIKVLPAWPAAPPTQPIVVVMPGEMEEAEQIVGEFVGQETEYDYDDEGDIVSGQDVWTRMAQFSATHHVIVYAMNENIATTISMVALWALMASRKELLEEHGFYESRFIMGPMDIADEWGAPRSGTTFIFRRAVHITHRWEMHHTTRFLGPLLAGVRVRLEALPNVGEVEQ